MRDTRFTIYIPYSLTRRELVSIVDLPPLFLSSLHGFRFSYFPLDFTITPGVNQGLQMMLFCEPKTKKKFS